MEVTSLDIFLVCVCLVYIVFSISIFLYNDKKNMKKAANERDHIPTHCTCKEIPYCTLGGCDIDYCFSYNMGPCSCTCHNRLCEFCSNKLK
jgi:hypothetical protein